jgi:hypothetical protein
MSKSQDTNLCDVGTKLLLVRAVHPNPPSWSAIKPSTETLIE